MEAFSCRIISGQVQQREYPRASNEARGKSLCPAQSMGKILVFYV